VCALGANLMMTCYGLIAPSSGFLIPQLEDHDIGFGINTEEGSWLGKVTLLLFVNNGQSIMLKL
jgi:hypothetical protein